jgi:hypothetical protein
MVTPVFCVKRWLHGSVTLCVAWSHHWSTLPRSMNIMRRGILFSRDNTGLRPVVRPMRAGASPAPTMEPTVWRSSRGVN